MRWLWVTISPHLKFGFRIHIYSITKSRTGLPTTRSPSRILQKVFFHDLKGQEQACLLSFQIWTRNCQKNSHRRSLEHFDHEESFLNLTSSLMDQNYGISRNFYYFNADEGLEKLTKINWAYYQFPVVIWQVFSLLMTSASQRFEHVEYRIFAVVFCRQAQLK